MNSETIDWLLEHSASAYEAEFKATGQLRDRISFVLSVAITPYAGIAIYLISKFKGSFLHRYDFLLFSLPIFIATGLLVVAACFVAHTLIGIYGYSNVPRPAELLPYLRDHPEPDKALEEAKVHLIKEYADNIEHNFKLNQNRARKLRIAQRLAVASVLVLAIALPRFVYLSLNTKAEAQSIKITEPVRITEGIAMSNNANQNSQPNTSTQAPNQGPSQQQSTTASNGNPASVARPPFPRSHVTLEHLVDKLPPGKTTLNEGKK